MIVSVVGRKVNYGDPVMLGVEDDQNVEQIAFRGLPTLSEAQLVTLQWERSDRTAGDIVGLVRSEGLYVFPVTESITQYGGADIDAFLEVLADDKRWSTFKFKVMVVSRPDVESTVTPPEPTIFEQLLGDIADHREDMAAQEDRVGEMVAEAQALSGQIADDAQAVVADREATVLARGDAEEAAAGAGDSEESAGASAAQAAQALSDLIAMLGSQVATLGPDGKLTPGQIPPISINDVFPVPDAAAMLALTAQRGDTALIVTGGVVVDSYILMTDDPTQLTHWAKLGVSYVANAGHANTAGAATDSERINGKRLIGMTQTQYDAAQASGTLDDDTYYIVTPD